MVGTISLYDALGERQHDLYWRNSRVWQSEFSERLEREIGRTKARYPQAPISGLPMVPPQTGNSQASYHQQVLDFYHASGYLGGRSRPYPKDLTRQQQWLTRVVNSNTPGSAAQLMNRCVSYSITNTSSNHSR